MDEAPRSPQAPLTIGIDVGGTKTLGALVRPGSDGRPPEVLDREQVPSGAHEPTVVDGMVAVARALIDRTAAGPGGPAGRVGAIGVGLAGFVGLDGVVRRAPNAPGLVGRDVAGRIAAALDVPVTVDNDANCVAVAAHDVDAPEARHLVAVTLGTGIGGGLIVDGRLVRGANGFAGEPGHMVVDPEGPRCPCGQRGCWERYASGAGLAWLARRAVEAGDAPALAAAVERPEDLRGEHVTDLVLAGDDGAEAVLETYVGYVALGVANLVVLLDPEVVVLGGGLSAPELQLVDRVNRVLAERYVSAVGEREVRVIASPGGPEAGALGAALLAHASR